MPETVVVLITFSKTISMYNSFSKNPIFQFFTDVEELLKIDTFSQRIINNSIQQTFF